MEHELTKEQIESLIFLGQLGTKYSKDEITELGIFPSNVLAPKVLPQWVAQKIKKINGKYIYEDYNVS